MLHYGFGRNARGNQSAEKFWQDKYNSLSEAEKKEFYHDFLPAILMVTDIGMVSLPTIPHIVERLKFLAGYVRLYANLLKYVGDTDPKKYLEKYIGFEANVATLTTQDFLNKWFKEIRNKFKYMDALALDKGRVLKTGYESEKFLVHSIPESELPAYISYKWWSEENRKLFEQRLTGSNEIHSIKSVP